MGRSHLREAGVQLALTVGPREGSETGPLGAVRLGSQQRTELSPGGTRQAVVAGSPAKGAEPLTPRGRDDHGAGGGRGGGMTTERVAAARRGCKRTKVKITQKPALARKSQEAVLKTSSGAAPCGVNRTPGPAGLNLKSDLNSTALRPCCGDRSCMWSRRVTWEKPGGVSGGGCGPRDSSGSGILDRTRSPQVRPPAGFRPPRAPQSGRALLGLWAR